MILATNGRCPRSMRSRAIAAAFDGAFAPLGFEPQSVLERFSTRLDWDPQARVLTDQYSPANLLNSPP